MFDLLFRNAETADDAGDRQSLREKFEDWRFRCDVAAIMAALDRLSDRHLAIIGLHRDTLFEAVSDMMLVTRRQREIGHEVLALLENSTDAHGGVATPRKLGDRTAVSEAA